MKHKQSDNNPHTSKHSINTLEEALSELKRNFALRRILLITLNLLVPACVLSSVRFISLSELPKHLEIVQIYCIPVPGLLISLTSLLIAFAILRCQFGIVANAALVNWIIYGKEIDLKPNLLGVTAGFNMLSVLSIDLGLCTTLCWNSVYSIPQLQSTYSRILCAAIMVITFSVAILKLSDTYKSACHTSNLKNES